MWDRPHLLNRLANAFFALAALIALYAAGWALVRMPLFALREVRIVNEVRHVQRAHVEAVVKSALAGTFFTLDLPQVRAAFENVPWVREVNLRRRWPARLEVTLVEHVALARWGETALVNTRGEVFHAPHEGKLPTFNGPEGTSKEIAIQYDFFRRNLAALGTHPAMVQLSPRRAWQVRLEGGPTLELGRDDIESRLVRYVRVHDRTVGTLKRRIDHVDLRYANGFAVRIAELKGEPLDAERPGTAAKRKPNTTRGRRTARQHAAPAQTLAIERRARGPSAWLRVQRDEPATGENAARRIGGLLRPERSVGAA